MADRCFSRATPSAAGAREQDDVVHADLHRNVGSGGVRRRPLAAVGTRTARLVRGARLACAALVASFAVAGCGSNAPSGFAPRDVICNGLEIPVVTLISPANGAVDVADDIASITTTLGGSGFTITGTDGVPRVVRPSGAFTADSQTLLVPTLAAHETYVVALTTPAIGSGACAQAATTYRVGSFTTR